MAVTRKKLTLALAVKGGLLAGVSAAIITNIYNYLYFELFHFSLDEYINFPVLTFVSIISSLIASAGYYMLVKLTRKYTFYFNLTCIIVLLLSFYWSFSATLPDGMTSPSGFRLLSMPLHVIVTLCIMIIIPKATDVRRY